jgi:hypothetical protein
MSWQSFGSGSQSWAFTPWATVPLWLNISGETPFETATAIPPIATPRAQQAAWRHYAGKTGSGAMCYLIS